MLLDVIIIENRKIYVLLIKIDYFLLKIVEDELDENVGDVIDGVDVEVIFKFDEVGVEVVCGLFRGVVRDVVEEVGVESYGEVD